MTEKNQHTPGPQGAHGSEDEIQAVIDRILAADDARRASEREATGHGSADGAAAEHRDAPDAGTPDRSGALAGRALALDGDRKSTRLNSSHSGESRMPSSA